MESRRKQIIRNVLLGFVLVIIGFIAGKEVTRMRLQHMYAERTQSVDAIIVYYMHSTIRCVTCNKIEELTRSVVEQTFSRELEDGAIQWETVNIDNREDIAERQIKDIDQSISFLQKRIDDIEKDIEAQEDLELTIKGKKKLSFIEIWQRNMQKHKEFLES